jgi:hypothetical protein
MSLNRISPADRARFARTLRREIALVQARRTTRLDLVEALDHFGELQLREFFHDGQLLHRLRRAANALEFVPEDAA